MAAQALFLKVKGAQVGPLSSEEFRSLVKARKINPEDLIWDDELEEWVPLTESDLVREFLIHPDLYERVILAVGGGKGGVGKTAVVVSMGVTLASMGKKVILVDADLGGANLHSYLGIDDPRYTFYDFYTGKKDSLEEIVLETPIENLFFISGASGTLGLANPKYAQKVRFIKQLRHLPADYILLDLGAGSSFSVIDFFLAAGEGIVISTPEPAAVQETFFFIKKALLRKLQMTFKQDPRISPLFNLETSSWNEPKAKSVKDLYKAVEKLDKDAAGIFRGLIQRFQPKLILNMVRKSGEAKEGVALKTAVGELLTVEMDYWGTLPFDERVREAAMVQRPFVLTRPNSKASRALTQMVTGHLLKESGLQGYLDRRRIRKILSRLEVPESEIAEEPIICSVRCSYWGDCEYQNGGYPCSIRSLELVVRKK
ncbi:MAG TPA: DUF4339 domain-containing protein [Bacteroidetes bacterium]|nr:DUF4339 domain-containing protein [Bacteroidota bacterium]